MHLVHHATANTPDWIGVACGSTAMHGAIDAKQEAIEKRNRSTIFHPTRKGILLHRIIFVSKCFKQTKTKLCPIGCNRMECAQQRLAVCRSSSVTRVSARTPALRILLTGPVSLSSWHGHALLGSNMCKCFSRR